MTTNLQAIEAAVLGLPVDERSRLLDLLIASLDRDAQSEAEWDAEADRRAASHRAGSASSDTFDAVVARLEARFPGA